MPRNSVTLPTPLAGLPATAWRWVGGAIAGYVVVSMILGVLSLLTIAVSGSDSDLDDVDPTGAGGAVRGFAWLTTYGWTGHVGLSYDDDWISGGAGATTPIPVYTVAALVALALTVRWLTRRLRPSSRAALWLQIGLVVGACFVVLLVGGLIARFSEDDVTLSPLAFVALLRFLVLLTGAIVAGVALAVPPGRRLEALFGARVSAGYRWVATALDAALCHVLAWTAVGLLGGLIAGIVLREDVPFGLSLGFLTTYGPMAAVLGHFGGISFSASGDQDAVDFLPASGDLGNETLTLFSGDAAWYLWLLPLVAVVVMALIAVRLTLLRAPGAALDIRQMAITTGAFLLTWFVVVRIIGRLSVDGRVEAGEESASGSLGLGPAWWAFILLALCGLVVELVHGFVGARLALALPRGLLQRLVPHPHPEWGPYLGASLPSRPGGHSQPGAPQQTPGGEDEQTTAARPIPPEEQSTWVRPASGKGDPPEAESTYADEDLPTSVNPVVSLGFDGAAPQAGAPAPAQEQPAWTGHAQAPQQWGQPQPMSRRAKIAIGALVGFIAVIGLGWFLLGQVSERYFGPEGAALEYAEAVVEGRGDDAMDMGSVNIADSDRALLGDAVYGSASGRPDSAEVEDVVEADDGESATVVVEFEQEGERFTQSLTVERDGRTMLFFPTWELQSVPVGQASVTVDGTALEVNGERLDLASMAGSGSGSEDASVQEMISGEDEVTGYRVSLPAFPGTYTFEIPGTTWTTSESVQQKVTPVSDVEDGSQQQPSELSAEPTDTFRDELTAGVKKKIDDCSTDYRGNSPCPFDAPDLLGEDDRIDKVEIVVDEYPELPSEGLDTPTEGQETDLSLSGSPSITEKGKYVEDTFGHDKGDTSESERAIRTHGWSVTVEGDELTVSWDDSF